MAEIKRRRWLGKGSLARIAGSLSGLYRSHLLIEFETPCRERGSRDHWLSCHAGALRKFQKPRIL
jgi:hypothetical protein